MKRESILENLNDKQLEAVMSTEGPLLVLAGAGSGKTRVITHRIAYLISKGVSPWNILAITFTNKAADEMLKRVNSILSSETANEVWVSTFHAMCVRFLRRDIDKLGYQRDFSIYDTDDQKTLIKRIIRNINLDTKIYREKAMQNIISKLKNDIVRPAEFEQSAADFYDRNVAKIYYEYERELKGNNALDFDDLLLKSLELFSGYPDVVSHWQERFKYILIDEYQDTNNVQFNLTSLLAQRYKNLCVVGDDDQSIYKFRGANLENILNFEKVFGGTKVVKLEQNYRSTGAILDAANEVIKNNRSRKEKKLWTKNKGGILPEYREYETASDEARNIINEVIQLKRHGIRFKDQAVLYRTNAQSRLFEEKCVEANIPYVIVGGVNFYQRKEIKDVLSYLRVIANGTDDLAARRIINVPKRGIGAKSVSRIGEYASLKGISFFDALADAKNIPGLGNVTKKIQSFVSQILGLRNTISKGETDISGLMEKLMDEVGITEELKKDDPVSFETRLANIEELKGRAILFEADRSRLKDEIFGASETSDESFEGNAGDYDDELEVLSAFLEDVSLVSDIDRTNNEDDVLTMMTLHAAKGLEFDTVYLCGMEDGLFPSANSINADDPVSEIEEERRLCYVGMTRAKQRLLLSSARQRMINGELVYTKVSRFISEIPDNKARKHFLRGNVLKRGDSFSGFGGYEERLGDELSKHDVHPDQEQTQKPDLTDQSNDDIFAESAEERAYSAYNSFPRRVYGNYGSLDTSSTKRASRNKPQDLNRIPGVQKGFTSLTLANYFSKQKPSYEVGDTVEHVKFGIGRVTDITEAKRDFKVTVDFDGYGTKVMYAAFAKLKKIESM